MAEFSAGFKIFADASQFQREMRQSVESAKQVQRGLRDIGLNIGKFVGVTAIASWFTGTAQAAQDLRDEIQKIGGTVDGATARVAAFGDGLDEVKKISIESSISVISWFNKMGEVLAYLPLRLTGVSAANEATAMKVAEDTEASLKRIAKARQEYGPEKVAAVEKDIRAEKRRNALESASTEGRLIILLDEQHALKKEMAEFGKDSVKYKERELALEKLTGEIRKGYADLAVKNAKEKAEAIKEAEKAEADAAKSTKERADAVLANIELQRQNAIDDEKKLAELNEQRTKLAAELADQAEREAAAKVKQLEIETELTRLGDAAYADAINFMSSSTLDRTQVQSASSETLREIARRKQGNLQSLGASGGSLAFDDNYFLRIQLQNEINQVKAELGMRESLSTNVAQRGIEGARRAFGGDPLVFDKLVQQFVQDSRNAEKINQENNRLLTDIRDRFKNGVPVVNLNSK